MKSKLLRTSYIIVCLLLLLLTACDKCGRNAHAFDSDTAYQEATNPILSGTPSPSRSFAPAINASNKPTTSPTATPSATHTNTTTIPVVTSIPIAEPKQSVTQNTVVTSKTSLSKSTDAPVESSSSPSSTEIIYDVFFEKEGIDFTLIADSISRTFLVMDNVTKSIRQTGYQYIEYFEIFPGGKNPTLGSSGDLFVFLSQNCVVASNGKEEWILETVGDADKAEKMQTGYIAQNGNKILAYIFSHPNPALLLVDLDTVTAHKLPDVGSNIEALIVLSGDYVLVGSNEGNMTTGYECLLYKINNGKSELIGILPGFSECEYTVEGNVVSIQIGSLSYEVDLESNYISSSKPISDELRLYYPIFCGMATIGDLSELKFIHVDDVVSIELPDYWKAYCWYYGDDWSFQIQPKNRTEAKIPRSRIGYFDRLEPYEGKPISKLPKSSTTKELLYSGTTFIGEGEIYLLEWVEPYPASDEEKDNIYELIYASIPIGDGTKAYALNIFVPIGEDHMVYFDIMKSLLKISE